MKKTVLTNDEDQYIIDPEKAIKIREWILATEDESPADYVNSFIAIYPNDNTVLQYKEGKITYEKLYFHVSVIRSRIPLEIYFDIHGFTDNFIMKRLRQLCDNGDEKTELGALKEIIKLKYKQLKPLRIDARQYIMGTTEEDKEEIVSRVYEKIRSSQSQPKRIKTS